MRHYTANYLLNPGHAVTVHLIGAGGTGSQMLSGLARINQALLKMNHPGLHVCAYDPDIVTMANIARQVFSPADLGMNKAICLVERINRFFGTEWQGLPAFFTGKAPANIIITCVDTVASRLEINDNLKTIKPDHETSQPYYWLDVGNLQYTGQCVIGTIGKIPQPKNGRGVLKNIVTLFPSIKKIKDAEQGPSCSLAEALTKQDLFINSTLAQFACNLIWKLFREAGLHHHGCFLNMDTYNLSPIKIL